MSGVLDQWVIYFNTTDHPDKFVVRRWEIGRGTITPDTMAQVCDDLDLARAVVAYHAPGSVRMAPMPDDDPVIVETWI